MLELQGSPQEGVVSQNSHPFLGSVTDSPYSPPSPPPPPPSQRFNPFNPDLMSSDLIFQPLEEGPVVIFAFFTDKLRPSLYLALGHR